MFPFPILRFLLENYLPLFKGRFLKKILIKEFISKSKRKGDGFKNPSPFFHETIGSDNYFTLIKNNQVFKIAKFEFKVTVQYGLSAKSIQLWPLKSNSTNICWLGNHLYSPAKWLRHKVVTGSRYCCYAPVLHWFCVVIGSIVVQDR